MTIEGLNGNVKRIKEIVRELYIFTNQLEMIMKMEAGNVATINKEEKELLINAINSLTNQVKILNKTIPNLVQNIGFYRKFPTSSATSTISTSLSKTPLPKLVEVKYNPENKKEKVSLVINDDDKLNFLENLSKSNLTINQLTKKYSVERQVYSSFGKPSFYAKFSNKFFRNLSISLVEKGYFQQLNRDLRKMNSPFLLTTYLSMMFFTSLIFFFLSLFLLIVLMFFNIGITFPFLTAIGSDENIGLRLIKFFWIILIVPMAIFLFMNFYPSSEAKSIGKRIEQELPFVTIHMSAIATSGIEPMNIFRIILKNEDYIYTNAEFKKLMNLVNFHGKDLVTALRDISRASPSSKLKELLDGLATTITSGGNLVDFLNKHAENLLFDYRLEREKYTKTSETFMDIYISIVIAAPMIFIMLFVIMGSTGIMSSFFGLTPSGMNILIILGIIMLNLGFLGFLRLKQPTL